MTRNISGSGSSIRQRGSGATGVQRWMPIVRNQALQRSISKMKKNDREKMDVEKREEYGKAAGIRVEYL